jgi:ribosomal protein L37AE/L43A
MTVPLPDMEWLYSSNYNASRTCAKCKSTEWNDIAEGIIECKECGNKEEV